MKPTNNTASTLTGLAVIFTILLSACSASATPSPTADVSVFYTQAAATIALGLTQTVEAMPSATPPAPTATNTLQPSATPVQDTIPVATNPPPAATAAASLTPVAVDPGAAFGCYNASFVSDVTLRYAEHYNPGDRFTKTWRVKNTGNCDWPRGFKIYFVSGDRFGTDTTTIDQKVSAGGITDISLAMTAPALVGVVISNWQLTTDIGKPFGPILSVSITLPGSLSGTAPSGGCLNSLLVADVTIPTGTKLDANTAFTKTWRVQNTGSCEWNGNFKFTFVDGNMFGADTTKIRKTVLAGGSMEISLDMTAPSTSGTSSSAWQMASDTGQLFGQLFAFSIVVK